MVYVDALRDWGWRLGPSSHLIADSNEELHAFAAKVGLKRSWFQRGTVPHYDLTANRRVVAVQLGAAEVSNREFATLIRKLKDPFIAAMRGTTDADERQRIRDHYFR